MKRPGCFCFDPECAKSGCKALRDMFTHGMGMLRNGRYVPIEDFLAEPKDEKP